ncbi:GatB/YqeY family protein [uncultured delta proteobacterium]|uniref:GatB/YqeY family protein n=1 Tax=uncultured delta proteobacterium TaxID=34034 RepID=A0A212J3F3_9DELT|nr:GatB/YqeY family protein [uncultured delta proteobacterium]
MSLSQRLESDYLTAYKSKDAVRLSVLRLLKTAMKNLLVERLQKPLEEGDILDLVAKQCKQRQDSIAQYTAANRPDLAAKEEEELRILKEYMPEQITGDALRALVRELAAETGAASPKDMGKIMQALTAKYKGQYDGKEASAVVRDVLAAG